jgi:lauroyl/myristoyl acyltransferase
MYRLSRRDPYFAVVIALVKISRRFPIRLRRALVSVIAFAASQVSLQKRRLAREGVERAFGGQLASAQKEKLATGAFYHFWRESFWLAPSKAELKLIAKIPLRGEEHLRSALSLGKGVILLENNQFGSRNLARLVLHARGYAIHQVHAFDHAGSGFDVGRDRSGWGSVRLRDFCQNCEMEFLAEIIRLPKTSSLAFTRELVDRLKRNCIVCIAGGGQLSQRLITLPLFGIGRTFSTGIVSLARSSGAPMLPLFCIDRGDPDIEVIIEPPLEVGSAPTREASVIEGVRQSVVLLEQYCRKYPEQFYGWSDLALTAKRAIAFG